MKRYVFDLTDLCADLNLTADLDRHETLAEAWLIEHLRGYHFLDLEELEYRRRPQDLHCINDRCPRLVQALTRTLYRLFYPMALAASNAFLTEVTFKRRVLTVTLYEAY